MDQGPDAALERELTRLFRRARSQSASLAHEVHPELDATGYAVLLWLLDRTGTAADRWLDDRGRQDLSPAGVRASELADFLRTHKSTASRTVAELEQLGLLDRVVDPTDARARLLTLSDRGRAAVTRSRDGRRARIAAVLDRWPADDLAQLATLLGRLNDDFD